MRKILIKCSVIGLEAMLLLQSECQHSMADQVYDYVQSASSMGALLILK
jgi:hypothetical protein